MCCGNASAPTLYRVPKILHQIWVGPPMPDLFADFADRWRALHPDWEYRLWGEAELADLEMKNRAVYDRADAYTADAYHAAQMRSDVARYEILHNYGGVYVDSDEYPLKPIDPLIAKIGFGIGWETDNVWLANGVIAAAPNHPVMAEIVRKLPARVDKVGAENPNARPNNFTGPKFVTPLLRNRAGVTRWPSRVFYPLRWDEVRELSTRRDYGDSYGVQLWSNSHRRGDLPLPDLAAVIAS